MMKEIDIKKWGICIVAILGGLLVGMAVLTYIIDPYFHFHKPYSWVHYRLYEQRYINDGISRHFDYDAVITGNSLSENMQASEYDELFDCKSVKLTYSGASFKELWGSLDRTLSYNPDIEQVLVIFDYDDITKYPGYVRYKEYPEYLYDDNIWNDASYLWNKDVFYRGTLYNLLMTLRNEPSTTFDEYSAKAEITGEERVLSYVGDLSKSEDILVKEYSDIDESIVKDNINQNVLSVIEKYPNVQFSLVINPVSIAAWARYYNVGEIEFRIEGCHTAAEMLLQKENVKIYEFVNDFDIVCDLDNYTDTIHYTTEVNSYMLEKIAAGQNEITLKNLDEFTKRSKELYMTYDYYSLMSVDNLK